MEMENRVKKYFTLEFEDKEHEDRDDDLDFRAVENIFVSVTPLSTHSNVESNTISEAIQLLSCSWRDTIIQDHTKIDNLIQDEDLGKRLAHRYPFLEPEVDYCDRQISKVKIDSFKGRPIMLLFSTVTKYRHKDIAMWFQALFVSISTLCYGIVVNISFLVTSFVSKTWPLEVVVQNFCSGTVPYGLYYDHVLGYEELKGDDRTHVKRLAEFIGYPRRWSRKGSRDNQELYLKNIKR
ncbi:hypothetical protein ACFE04_010659 [Oxalis oulophora]